VGHGDAEWLRDVLPEFGFRAETQRRKGTEVRGPMSEVGGRTGEDDLDECPRARMIRMIPSGLDDWDGKGIGAEVGGQRSEGKDRCQMSDVRSPEKKIGTFFRNFMFRAEAPRR